MTDVLEAYAGKIRAINGLTLREKGKIWDIKMSTESDNPKTATKEIRMMQKQLRVTKRELNLETKVIRQQYRAAIADATYQPGFGGALFGSKYRSAARRTGADKKRRLRDQRDSALAPYEAIKSAIDRLLLQLDVTKAQLQVAAARQADL